MSAWVSRYISTPGLVAVTVLVWVVVAVDLVVGLR